MPVLLLLVAVAGWLQVATAPALRYPAARRDSIVDDYHGVLVEDPYRWLEQSDDAATVTWVREEDRLAATLLKNGAARTAIGRRLTALSQRVRVGVPWR